MDLALLVAVHSQKDPQEYRSLLQRYRDMKERKKRYCIDVELKRWPRVLKDISDLIMHCDEIDEELGDENVLWKQAVRLMREKSLETEFLDAFDSTPYSSRAHQCYADFLTEKGNYEVALIEYQCCNPQPVESMMTCALHLGRSDLYLALLFASQKDSSIRTSAIRRLCDALRTGPSDHIRQCARVSVVVRRRSY